MAPRRGFPTEANWIASDVRAELGLEPEDRLDPLTLADALDIPVTRMSELRREAPRVVAYFSGPQQGAFSAMTLFCGRRRTIIHNDAHSPARQVSNITHELSHGLLLHPRTPPLDAVGLRASDRALEEEAGWLTGALLISEASALLIAERGWSVETAATHYGVSQRMVQFRLNVTGAPRRVGARVRRRKAQAS